MLQTVKGDLEFLMNQWTQDIDDDSMRRSSSVLRILLVDEALLLAWREAGFREQPIIKAPSLEPLLTQIRKDRIAFAQAGGAKFKGEEVSNIMLVRGSPEEAMRFFEAQNERQHIEYTLAQFVKSPCIVVSGNIVNRQEVIKYVCNKLGGTHIDTSRDVGSKNERKRAKEQKFVALDSVYDSTEIAGKNAIFFELLSIGQNLVRSEDIKRLVSTID